MSSKSILILTPFYYPNVGGVETHLTDLTTELVKKKYSVYVLTYSPITTSNTKYSTTENFPNLIIRRYPWFGKTLFHSLEKYPLFDFLYLTPYLSIRAFFWMLNNSSKIEVIHSHGFNAAFIGNILSIIFHKRHITSTHAVYDHISGLSQKLVVKTLNYTDHILCLSQASANQLTKWGINPQKISLYSYWVNLNNFSSIDNSNITPTFLFVGRLIVKKGIHLFLKLSKQFPHYRFIVVGTGPEESAVKQFSDTSTNLRFLGLIPNESLSKIYRQSTVLCVPSLYAEGYGRVVIEAVASGIPVIASNLGGLPEALDNTVAILVSPTLKNFSTAIRQITNINYYHKLQLKCRQYATTKFSPKNISQITKFY